MGQIKVSVIIPVRNVEKYLDAAICSMVYQTLSDIEIIIVNNGSTDQSKEIITRYKDLFPNKIITIDAFEDFSPGYARNVALQYATGEYVYFMDSDDITKIDLLETLYAAAKLEDVGIATLWGKGLGQCIRIKDDDQRQFLDGTCDKSYRVIDTVTNPGFIYDDSMTVWSKLFKRDIIPKDPFITGETMEDLPFCCSMDLSQQYIAFCREAEGYGYRQRNGSITKQLDKITPEILSIIKSCAYGLEFAKQIGLDQTSIAKAKDIYKKYIVFWLDRINEWNMPEERKLHFMKQFCAIANTMFGKLNEPEFFKRHKYSNTLYRLYDDIIDDSSFTDEPQKQLLLLNNDLKLSSKHQ